MKENCATALGDETGSEDATIWVVTDGRAGNEAPALALARATARGWEAETGRAAAVATHRLAFRAGAELLPAFVWDAMGASAALGSLADGGAALQGDGAARRPDLIIGAGRRSGPVAAALKRSWGTRAAQILWPQMPVERFDRVIAPAHDRSPERATARAGAGRVIRTVGSLTDVSPEALADLRTTPDPRLTGGARPLIGVLVGGPSRSAKFDRAACASLARALETLADTGAGLAGTGSRRTPDWAADALGAAARGRGGFWWDGSGANPYRAILAAADALIVTADSVNMASEAASSGRPVYVAQVGALSAKLERFHAALRAGGHARPLERGLERGRLEEWRSTPLSEIGSIARDLVALILADRGAAARTPA